jgi:hypothetical protein
MILNNMTPEQEAALSVFLSLDDSTRTWTKAMCTAELLDAFGYPEWAARMREAQHDGDRVRALAVEFEKFINAKEQS